MEPDPVREGITELLKVIDHHSHLMKSPPLYARQFAAAGLMRCCHALRAICCLENGGFGSLVGILERHIWEVSIVSLYVLFGKKEELEAVVGAHVYEKNLILTRLRGTKVFEDWSGPKERLKVEQLYNKVKGFLVAAGETIDSEVSAYDAIYRVQSFYSAHAGLETISRYLTDVTADLAENEIWGVAPTNSVLVSSPALSSGQITLHLAQYVFKSFGLPDHFWKPINEKLRLPASGDGAHQSSYAGETGYLSKSKKHSAIWQNGRVYWITRSWKGRPRPFRVAGPWLRFKQPRFVTPNVTQN
jgi:hypothetical protein